MVLILGLTLVLGLGLLIGTAYAIYRWELKALALLVPAVLIDILALNSGLGFGLGPMSLSGPMVTGAIGGYVFKKGKSFHHFLLSSTLVLTALFSGGHYYLLLHRQYDMLSASRTEISRVLSRQQVPEEVRKDFLANIDGSIELARHILPFLFFLNALFLSAPGFFFIRGFFSRRMDPGPVDGLLRFRMSDFAIFFLIGGWALYILVNAERYPLASMIGLNTGLIATVFYFIQSLGVLSFFISKRGLPVYILPLALLFFMIMGPEVFVFVLVVLTGLGALDFWADFRKLGVKENNANDQ